MNAFERKDIYIYIKRERRKQRAREEEKERRRERQCAGNTYVLRTSKEKELKMNNVSYI